MAALEEGLTQRSACIAANISVSCLRDWRNEDPTIGDKMEESREKVRRATLLIIKSAALSGDWRAASEFLKLTFPNDYRNTAGGISVTATAQISGVVVTEEDRQILIQRRQEMLANQATHQLLQRIRP